jgi:sulfur carrier protein
MTDPKMIEISVNGEPFSVPAGATISELLTQLKISSRAIAVERNQEVQPFHGFHQQMLEPGDCLEIVTLVGGG